MIAYLSFTGRHRADIKEIIAWLAENYPRAVCTNVRSTPVRGWYEWRVLTLENEEEQ